MQNTATTRKCLEKEQLSNKPTLILTRQLQNKIDYLHKKVGNHEWSGELITREEGTINDLQDWKITAEDIFLADIGTGMYTEYTVDKGGFKAADVIELYEAFPGLEDGTLKNHHIHTHVNMGTFFSGTDWEQMNDRALVSNYLLMLIVNMKGEAIAKVGFRAKREGNKTKLSFVNNSDGYAPFEMGADKEEEVLVMMDCKIEIETSSLDIPAEFEARYERVSKAIEDEKKEEEEARKKKYGSYSAQRQLPFYEEGKGKNHADRGNWNEEWSPNENWDSDLPWNSYSPNSRWEDDWELDTETQMWTRKKEKKISNMTDKEWQKFEADEEAKRAFEKDQGENVKFEEKHARALLNSILNGTYMMEDYRDLREPLIVLNKDLKGHEEMETYVDMWQDMLQEHFDVIYPKATVEKYGELMNVIHTYLSQYKWIRLVQEMLESVKDEIEMSYTPKTPA